MRTVIYSSEDKEMTKRVKTLLARVSLSCLGNPFHIIIETDKVNGQRVYLQIMYSAPCNKGGYTEEWKGRKWYLSEFMTDDEIIKTCYAAFQATINHEVMEGFKVDGIILFNPHTNFEELLKISEKEVKRPENV
jgi:hypothetical protein